MEKTQIAQAEGNTNSSALRSRKWCLTMNNYIEKDITQLSQYFHKYVIGKEVGEEKKTPHLQCYFEQKNAIAFTTLKKLWPRGHWEKPKGSRKANIKYCSKENDFIQNFYKDKKKILLDKYYKDVKWKDWQQNVINIIEGEPDMRKIHWFVDRKGNTGKSFLVKYISLKYGCIIGDGKKNDVFNQIKTADDNDENMKIIIIDCPRTMLDYVNYGAIESIKNGMIYSGKYEGGQVHFEIPHVIIMANEEPNYNGWSEDRYDVRYV